MIIPKKSAIKSNISKLLSGIKYWIISIRSPNKNDIKIALISNLNLSFLIKYRSNKNPTMKYACTLKRPVCTILSKYGTLTSGFTCRLSNGTSIKNRISRLHEINRCEYLVSNLSN